MIKSKKDLILENKELRSRLSEAEELLLAIRRGEMDAIVISDAKGEQIYSLSSAETPYRTFVEEMHGGAVTLTKEGMILYCNNRFSELIQKPVNTVIGSKISNYLTPIDRLNFENLLAQLTPQKNGVLIISLLNLTYLKLSIRLLPAYLHGDNYILIATDITMLKNKEFELLGLQQKLKQQLVHLQDLRLDIINAKIETDSINNKLKNTIKKLEKKNLKHKEREIELTLKLKQRTV